MGAPQDDARVRALAEELGAQLRRLKGAGPKLTQFLSMLQLDRAGAVEQSPGALPEGAHAVPFGRVRRVIEHDLGARMRDVFAEVDEVPFALASLGQVHRGRTSDGTDVAIKVQHPGAAEAIDADLRNLGLVGPLVGRLAPAVDTGGLLAELRGRVGDELDYEIEAQHQRRVERMFRDHPHVRVPRVHTELSARRVLVSDYVDGVRLDDAGRLDDAERDRIGEVAFRFFAGLAWRDGIVAGDPRADNCILGRDGRLWVLDFGLVRDLDEGYLQGESAVRRAVADEDAQRVCDGLSELGYLPGTGTLDCAALLEHFAAAGEWMLARGVRRIDPGYVARVLELGYPPHSPYLALMRGLRMPPQTLLLRRMEVQLLALLGDLHSAADWGAIAAEHHAGAPASTPLGREDHALHTRRTRR